MVMNEGADRMKRLWIAGAAALLGAWILLLPTSCRAQDVRGEIETIVREYLAAHPDEVVDIIKTYLVKHPEAVGQILAELLKRRPAAAGINPPAAGTKSDAQRSEAVTANANLLFSSQHQVVLGDPHGDITLVEFFDYNCGFCKRALSDTLTLLQDDPHLKIVLKEFPILGPESAEVARVAVGVRMQDPDGRKYLAFHRELLGSPGLTGKDKALAAAKAMDIDLSRLERDIAGDEVTTTLAEDMKLASAIGVTGTPGYVVGEKVVLGAVGIAGLKAQIASARGRPN
jgi:protein-disulfide isomerase